MRIWRKKNWAPAGAGATMLLMVACATLAPGEDPKGQQLKEPANKVLTAIDQFKQDKGRYPNSLYELMPKYVDKLPEEPLLRIDEHSGRLRFAYSREWPDTGRIVCIALFGTTDWKCEASD
jgi:hypothetical protein